MLRLEEENIYAGVATSGSGGGGSGGDDDSKDVRVLQAFSVVDKTDDGVYSVEWTVEKPDLQYDTYVSTFTFNNKSGNKYVFTAGETTKDGVVKGHPHIAGWFTFYDSTQSTAFDLPEFTYDSETGEYSAELDGYEFSFSITEESETQDSFVGGLVYKNGVELGDFNLGFWNEPLPLKKGSFDSATQQLTLNYDYLVEKINSSTVVTDEQKSAMIALLNNQSLVIDMTSEPETMPENDYVYGFIMTAGGTGIGESYVDKQTPVTLKLAVTPDSPGIIGSYEAIAGFFTQMSGQPTTPEMIEAQYAPFIVDENICTVSGTIGNFSVKFDKDEPEKPIVEKYGATVGNFLGDVDENGILQAPSGTVRNLSFKGIKGINSSTDGGNPHALYSFYYKFCGCQNIGDVTFPDLISCRMMCLSHAFQSSSITSLSMPKFTNFANGTTNDAFFCSSCKSLKSVSFPSVVSSATTGYNTSWFYSAFNKCTALETVDFSGLESITEYGVSFFSSAFSDCTSLKQAIMFPKLKAIKTQAFYNAFSNTGLETQTFPVLETLWDRGLQYAFTYCSSLRSLSFPALKSNSFSTYTNVFNNMLSSVTGCTVHFPSNLESVIGSWSDVTAGFGGRNTTVLFDLPATE